MNSDNPFLWYVIGVAVGGWAFYELGKRQGSIEARRQDFMTSLTDRLAELEFAAREKQPKKEPA